MERITELRNELRKEMLEFLKGTINEDALREAGNKTTDQLYELCGQVSVLKTAAGSDSLFPEETTTEKTSGTHYTIYTDGGYSIQRNIGGAAFVKLFNDETVTTDKRTLRNATNNIAELTAILMALQSLEPGESATIISDSQYAIGVLDKNWSANANTELISEIKQHIIRQKLTVNFEWVKGHNKDRFNEMCDKMCGEAMKQ